MQALNVPYSMIILERDAGGLVDAEAENRGKVFVTSELGGGGSATPHTVSVAKRGLRNVLHHAGILPGAVEMRASVQLDMPDARCFVTSEHAGLLEFMVELGPTVAEGEDRQSVMEGKSVSVRVGLGGGRIMKQNTKTNTRE